MPVIERVIKPKTHKGKKALIRREPKLIEDPKQTLFIKGTKTNPVLLELLKDLHSLKKPEGQALQKRNEIHPFEDATPIEAFARKHNAALFALVSNSKKRPNNLILGRTFEHTAMDLVEFGVESYTSLGKFAAEKVASGIKPMLVFQGEAFESNHELARVKNLLVDLFQREVVGQVRLQGLEHVMSFTALDNCVLLRSYRAQLKKSGTRVPRIELVEIGPRMDLRIRRTKLATEDLFKQACKRPKELKVKKKKNISADKLGSTLGRVHIGAQKLNSIQTRKMKGLKKTASERKLEKKRKSLDASNGGGVGGEVNASAKKQRVDDGQADD